MTVLNEKYYHLLNSGLYCLGNNAGSKKEIILLHGAKFSAKTWHDLGTLDILCQKGYPVYALDMPGFGNTPQSSDKPGMLLQEFIKQENLDRPVVIGPSMGGNIALDLYFGFSDHIGGLILVGTVGVQNYQNRFQEINVPCLLVWGEEDTISPPENADFLHNKIRESELVMLEKSRHPCYLDQPERWHEVILDFLERKFD